MKKFAVVIAVTVLVASGTISVIALFRPGTPVAVLPHGIAVDEIQRRVDVKSLPVLEITDVYGAGTSQS